MREDLKNCGAKTRQSDKNNGQDGNRPRICKLRVYINTAGFQITMTCDGYGYVIFTDIYQGECIPPKIGLPRYIHTEAEIKGQVPMQGNR